MEPPRRYSYGMFLIERTRTNRRRRHRYSYAVRYVHQFMCSRHHRGEASSGISQATSVQCSGVPNECYVGQNITETLTASLIGPRGNFARLLPWRTGLSHQQRPRLCSASSFAAVLLKHRKSNTIDGDANLLRAGAGRALEEDSGRRGAHQSGRCTWSAMHSRGRSSERTKGLTGAIPLHTFSLYESPGICESPQITGWGCHSLVCRLEGRKRKRDRGATGAPPWD